MGIALYIALLAKGRWGGDPIIHTRTVILFVFF